MQSSKFPPSVSIA